jgi:5-methylcytosine-specific restriction endonuclease McrA
MPAGIYIRTEEARKNMSFAHKGKPSPRKGCIVSDEQRRKISLANKGKRAWNKGLLGDKSHLWGRKHSEKTKQLIGALKKGKPLLSLSKDKSIWWKGGITPINQLIRTSRKYKAWRQSVFERDNYTCKLCGKRGVELNANHIKRFVDYPDLRMDINNGITLCKPCHLYKVTRHEEEYELNFIIDVKKRFYGI